MNDDPRMVQGPAIANFIFFAVAEELAGSAPETTHTQRIHAIRALKRHEVFVESSGDSLSELDGSLALDLSHGSRENPESSVGALIRLPAGYRIEVPAGMARMMHMDIRPGTLFRLEFDVEYQQWFESPGGYSADYGIGYWDDVAYPRVEFTRLEMMGPEAG